MELDRADQFKALSSTVRIKILVYLSEVAKQSKGMVDVSSAEILEQFRLSVPNTSYNLKMLQRAGSIKSKKKGRALFVKINTESLDEIGRFSQRGLIDEM